MAMRYGGNTLRFLFMARGNRTWRARVFFLLQDKREDAEDSSSFTAHGNFLPAQLPNGPAHLGRLLSVIFGTRDYRRAAGISSSFMVSSRPGGRVGRVDELVNADIAVSLPRLPLK